MNDRSFALRGPTARAASGLLLLSMALSACGDSHEVDPGDLTGDISSVYDEDDDVRDASTTRPTGAMDGGLAGLSGLFDDLLGGFGARRDAGTTARDAGPRDASVADASVKDAGSEAGVADAGPASAICRAYPQLPFCPRDAGVADAATHEAGVGDAGADGGLEAGAGDAGADGGDAGDAGSDAGDAAADAGDAATDAGDATIN